MNEKRILASLSFEADWERQTLSGLIAFAREHDLHWEIRAIARSTDLNDFIKRFQPHGLLYHPNMQLPDRLPPELKTVYFDQPGGTGRPLLQIDDQQIGELAADHLLVQGFTRFCFAGNLNRYYAEQRLQGFRRRLRRAGQTAAEFNTAGCFLGLLNNREDPELFHQFTQTIAKLEKPLALFAVDDYEAYTAFELCLKAGWKIPDEIGILGVNNEELVCHACDPMLSSIRIPYRQIGYTAAGILHRQFQGKSVPKTPQLFPAIEIVERRSTATDQVSDAAVAKSLRYIQTNLAENISINMLTKLTGISRSMLERRFKESINRTPYFEIQHQRIERAKILLRDTESPISDIVPACGFNSATRFCQAFKEKTTLTPSQYRQFCRMH